MSAFRRDEKKAFSTSLLSSSVIQDEAFSIFPIFLLYFSLEEEEMSLAISECYQDIHWSEKNDDKTQYIITHPSLIQIDEKIHPLFGLKVLITFIRDYILNSPLLPLSCFTSTWISIGKIYQMLCSVADDESATEEAMRCLESCCRDEGDNLFSLENLNYGMKCNLQWRYRRTGLEKWAEKIGDPDSGNDSNIPPLKIRRFLRSDTNYTIYVWMKGLRLKNSTEMKFEDDDPTQPMTKVFITLAFGDLPFLKKVRHTRDYLEHLSILYCPPLREFVTEDVWNYLHESGDILNASLKSPFSSLPSEPLKSTYCQWGMIEYVLRKRCEILSVSRTCSTVEYEGKIHSLKLVTCTAISNGTERRYGFYIYGNGAMLPSCYILLMIAYRFLSEEARREYVKEIWKLIEEHFGLKGNFKNIWERDHMKDFFTPPIELEKFYTIHGYLPEGF